MGDSLCLRALAILAGLATTALAAPAGADDVAELEPVHPVDGWDGTVVNETTGLWFVELESPPAADGTAQATLADEHEQFRADARRRGLQYTERHEFETLFNGLSVRMDESQLGALRRTAGVAAVYPVVRMDIPNTTDVSPDLTTALAMTGADVAQSELGLTGAGIQVAVMDTGIDYHHPDLGGPGPFPTSRVVAGHDFVGDDFNAADPDRLTPAPDNDPMDCDGHGTHVAGIVGADAASDDGATGVAPGVTFGAYKVFGCTGSTTADVMIAAMEMALADGMDVLNMSIGSAFTWPQYPTAVAADLLVQRGVPVVASIGNSGADGLYSAGAPGVGEDVIGVASYDNTHIDAQTFSVHPGGAAVPYLPLASAADPPTSGTSPEVVYLGRGCTSLGDKHEADSRGKVALVVRGDCPFDEKYAGAIEAGAVGVVVYNNVPGLFAGGGVEDRGAFGVGISDTDGQRIRSLLDADETVTLTWTDERVNAPNPTGGLISSFSSYGLSPDLALKPDVGAPGGLIRSTYPLDQGGYATVSGTSMAAPHVAGGVALLLEARPDLAASDVRSTLQNSADPARWWGDPDRDVLDNVHRQGAGMVDIPGAVAATTTVTPSKIALGEGTPRQQQLVIANESPSTVTYTMSHEPALGTHGDTFTPSFNADFAEATFSKDTVTLQPGEKAVVRVKISPPAADADQMIYGGYLVVAEEGGSHYRVPYAGYAGDYQAIDAIRPIVDDDGVVMDLPWLATLSSCAVFIGLDCIDPGGTYENQPDGAVYTLAEVDGVPDVPYIAVHLDHQVAELSLTVLDAASGEPVHGVLNKAVAMERERRNSTPGGFFAYAWDGTLTLATDGQEVTRDVPDGTYRLRLEVLKAGGDDQRDEHWETWTSPPITIDREQRTS